MGEGSEGWYQTLERRTAYEGVLSDVRIDEVRMPDGEVAEREVVEHADAVGIVPVMDDGTIVLIRHYRHPVGGYLLEIPAGKLDVEGEAPRDAALRELREETGLAADGIEPLILMHNSAGWTTESTTIFLARGLRDGPAPDDFEPEGEERDLEIVRLPLEEAVAAVVDGTIDDAKTIVGLLLAERRLGT